MTLNILVYFPLILFFYAYGFMFGGYYCVYICKSKIMKGLRFSLLALLTG